MNNNQAKRLETLALETEANKKKLVKALRTTPIVQIACKKTGIGRPTYYKWREQDPAFARACDRALKLGESLINDVAESKLITSVQNGVLAAIVFWLKNNHNKYAVSAKDINIFNLASLLPSPEELSKSKITIAQDVATKLTAKLQGKNTRQNKDEMGFELFAREEIISAKMREYEEDEEEK